MRVFATVTAAVGLVALITAHIALVVAAGVMGFVLAWNIIRPVEPVELVDPSPYSRAATRGHR